jgi:carbamoyl-phosphate synthase large subunit
VISRQRIRVRSGEVIVGRTVFDRAIAETCVRIAQSLPAIGPITVQCMMSDSGPLFTEINARLGGGLPLGIAAGADSPRWLLARIAGVPIEIPPLGSYAQNLFVSRFDDALFITEAEREAMAGRTV